MFSTPIGLENRVLVWLDSGDAILEMVGNHKDIALRSKPLRYASPRFAAASCRTYWWQFERFDFTPSKAAPDLSTEQGDSAISVCSH